LSTVVLNKKNMVANEIYIQSTYYQYLNTNRSIFLYIRAREKNLLSNVERKNF